MNQLATSAASGFGKKVNEELAARVRAVNRANDEANKLYPILRTIFEPLVGQQIFKVGGGLLQKIEKLLPKFEYRHNDLQIYRFSSSYSLAWVVKTCEQVKDAHFCLYYEATVYVGELSGQVLDKMSNSYPRRTDYTVEEIEGLRAAYKAAKKACDDAQSALYPFGE